jgi:deoxyinosine 3'endonuclease (endonuclease V)
MHDENFNYIPTFLLRRKIQDVVIQTDEIKKLILPETYIDLT